MDLDRFMELTKALDKKKKGKDEALEKLQKCYERFHLVNRKFLDKPSYESSLGTIASIAESIANTLRYLEDEVARLRSKRMKLPFENVELGDMQKVQKRNELLLKEFLSEFPE